MSDEASVDDYVPGQILVTLKDTPESCEQNLAEMLGYEYLGDLGDLAPNTYVGDKVYRVPIGEEEAAIRRFNEQTFFVEGAYRRVKSFERICLYQEHLNSMFEEIYSDVRKPEDVMTALRGLEKVLQECIKEEKAFMKKEREKYKK